MPRRCAPDKSRGPLKNRALYLWTALTCFVPLSFLLNQLVSDRPLNSAALAVRIATARLLNGGSQLFVDICDWTCVPLLGLLKLDLQLSELLRGCASTLGAMVGEATIAPILSLLLPDIFVPLSIFVCLLLSIWVTARLALLSEESKPALPLCFALALTSLIVRFNFGDLQHILILTMTPWLVLRCRTWQGLPSPLYLRLIVGLAAGFGACLDPLYLVVFFVAELAFALSRGSVKALKSIDSLSFISVPLLYIIYLLISLQWQFLVELGLVLRMQQFGFTDPSIFSPLSTPARFDVFYVALFNLLMLLLLPLSNKLVRPLGCLLLLGLLIFVLQNDGRSFDLVLVIFANTAMLLLACVDWFKSRVIAGKSSGLDFVGPMSLLLSLILTVLVSQLLASDCERLGQVRRLAGQAQNELGETIVLRAKGKDLALLSDCGEPFYPAVLIGDCRPVLSLHDLQPLKLLQPLKEQNALSGIAGQFYQDSLNRIKARLEEKSASVLLVSHASQELLDKLGLSPIIARNYVKDGTTFYYSSDNRLPHEYRGYNWEYAIYLARTDER